MGRKWEDRNNNKIKSKFLQWGRSLSFYVCTERINGPKYEPRQLRIQKSSSVHCCTECLYFHSRIHACTHTNEVKHVFFVSVCACVIVLNKQKSLGFSNSTRACIIIYVQPSSFDLFYACEWIPVDTHTHIQPMRVNRTYRRVRKIKHWRQFDLDISVQACECDMTMLAFKPSTKCMQLYICIMHISILSLLLSFAMYLCCILLYSFSFTRYAYVCALYQHTCVYV